MGAVVILLGVAFMIVIHEGAHFAAAKAFGMKATEAFFGFGPTLWSIRRGETEYGIKAIPLGGYVRIVGMNPLEEIEPAEEHRTYRAAPFWKKAVVVLAGVASHVVVAFILFSVIALVWGVAATDAEGRPIPTTVIAAIAETTPDGAPAPAASVDLRPGDRIVAVDAEAVTSWEDFVAAVKSRPGTDVTLTIERGGERLVVPVRLAAYDRPVVVDGTVLRDDAGEPVTELSGFLGVTPQLARERPGVVGALRIAAADLAAAVRQSVVGLWELVTNFGRVLGAAFGVGDQTVLEEVRPISPIGLARIAGPLESSLVLLALVNVFVAVVNVVPLYPLDGGHFAVATWERLTGRQPDVRKLVPVAAVVLVFLVTLGLLGLYLDIFRPLQR